MVGFKKEVYVGPLQTCQRERMAHVLETQNKTCSEGATHARPIPPEGESRPEGQAADPAPTPPQAASTRPQQPGARPSHS